MRFVRVLGFLIFGVAFLGSCATVPRYPEDPLAFRRQGLRDEARLGQDGPFILEYRNWVQSLAGEKGFQSTLDFRVVPWEKGELGVVVLIPPEGVPIRGSIVAWHGFMSYSAYNIPGLGQLADEGWVVVAADLPGHGFSTGVSGYVDSFADYGLATQALVRALEDTHIHFPQRVILGHSAGGGASIEALLQMPDYFDKAILLAPLVIPQKFGLVRVGTFFASPFLVSLPPRGFEEGYLGASFLPLRWLRELIRWQRRLRRAPVLESPEVLVLWGEAEDSLNIQKSSKRLEKIWPAAQITVLPNLGHIVFDLKEGQERALHEIRGFLSLP